jgi:hypothetical protein
MEKHSELGSERSHLASGEGSLPPPNHAADGKPIPESAVPVHVDWRKRKSSDIPPWVQGISYDAWLGNRAKEVCAQAQSPAGIAWSKRFEINGKPPLSWKREHRPADSYGAKS